MENAPIVVGTDGSPSAERAVERAGQLASALGAPLHVVMACEAVTNAALIASAAGAFAPMVDDSSEVQDRAQAVLDRTQQRLQAKGIDARTSLCRGDPAEALMAVAAGEKAQMIVVGNRGMAGARRVLGSVPNRVSHRARCAVLIVPTGD
jgi:nucleotide-binding universal stress UspA family protein